MTLNYIEQLLVLVSKVIGCILFPAFACLDCNPRGITSYAIGLKICAITAEIKKYKSIIKKQKKKHKIILLARTNLNHIEVLIFKT